MIYFELAITFIVGLFIAHLFTKLVRAAYRQAVFPKEHRNLEKVGNGLEKELKRLKKEMAKLEKQLKEQEKANAGKEQ